MNGRAAILSRKTRFAFGAFALSLALLAFWAFVASPAALAQTTTVITPSPKYTTSDTGVYYKKAGRQVRWLLASMSKNAYDAAYTQMTKAELPGTVFPGGVNTKKLTLAQVIDSGASGEEALYLKAIVIHETDGGMGIEKNGSNGALCPFQIDPVNFKGIAAEEKIDPSQVESKLKSDIYFCLKWGKTILSNAKKFGMPNMFCYYNGQGSLLKSENWCWAADEYPIILAYLRGETPIIQVNIDKTATDFAKETVKSSSGEELGKSLNCMDEAGTYAKALAKMEDLYRIYTTDVYERAYRIEVKNTEVSKKLKDAVSVKKLCLEKIDMYWDVIQGMISEGNVLSALLINYMTSYLTQVCTYIVGSIQAAIAGIMNSLCIPIPNLFKSLSIKQMSRESCDGISLGDAMIINGAGLSESDVKAGLQKLYDKSGLPAINTLPEMRGSSPNLAAPLRYLFGTGNTGEQQSE